MVKAVSQIVTLVISERCGRIPFVINKSVLLGFLCFVFVLFYYGRQETEEGLDRVSRFAW